MTFLIALFLALAKRRDDVLILKKSGRKMRKSMDGYNLELIDNSMMIMSAVVIVAYIQYTTSQDIMKNSKIKIYISQDYLLYLVLCAIYK